MADPIDIRMPSTSPHEPIVLVRWLVPDHGPVSPDTPICELETEQAVMELPAGFAGTLIRLAEEGSTLRPGDVLARLIPR